MTMGLAERIQAVFELAPEKGAVEFKGKWHSWGELKSVMAQIESILAAAGLGEGATVGLILRNRPGTFASVLHLLCSKRCVVPINPFTDGEKIANDLKGLKLSAVIADPQDWDVPEIKAAATEIGALGIAVSSLPSMSVALVPGLEKLGPGPHHESLPGTGILMLTSGTTGPAKRIQMKYKNFEKAMLMQASLEAGNDGVLKLKESVSLLTGPLVHIGGTYHATASMVSARPIAILEKFTVADWHDLVKRHRPKVTALPPTAIRMVLDAKIPKEDLASLKCLTAGSAPLNPDMADLWEETYGFPILDIYGATEFAGGVASWTLKDHKQFWKTKRGSVGKALPGIELRVVDRDTGDILPASTLGVLEVRSPQVGDGNWIRTTDLVEIDNDGFVFIRGRADDAIIRGGFKVLPPDVEEALKKHPAVADVCVVGIPDERLGAVPVAAVQAREDMLDQVSEAELLAHVRKLMVAYMVPVAIKILPELPRTPAMKISKHEVKKLFGA
ncbi:MAG: class I adenylate-forming enzyme family protein [Spongiibacteraceae bacterium]